MLGAPGADMQLFLGDSLRDALVLEAVIGRKLQVKEIMSVPGLCLRNGGHPSEITCSLAPKDMSVDGVQLDLAEDEFERILYYQTVRGLTKAAIPNTDITTFVAKPSGPQVAYEDWHRKWADLAVVEAEEIMASFGVRSAESLAPFLNGLRLRSDARLRAANSPKRPHHFEGQVTIETNHPTYSKFFALSDYTVSATLFEGGFSDRLERAVFRGMDAAIVLPYDPVSDRVLLVEQLRMGPIARCDPQPWQFEPVAGHVDPGETPAQAAHRETREEAGLDIISLEPISECYPSPGASSEFYYIFLAVVDLADAQSGVFGVESEGENIRTHVLPYATFLELLEQRVFAVAPLVAAGYWLSHHRNRLRGG